MIAMVQEFPALAKQVDDVVSSFIKDETFRSKNNLRALGEFLPLLAVSKRIKWPAVAMSYLSETFDRNVIWMGKKYPSLPVQNLQKGVGVDTDRLNKSWEATQVSMKLLMFHVNFLRMHKNATLDEMAASYDVFFGRPSHRARVDFQENVKKIVSINAWPAFFRNDWNETSWTRLSH